VHTAGSPLRGISPEDATELLTRAFETWENASCAGGQPPLVSPTLGGAVECDQPEFNCDMREHNDNTLIFRDDTWPLSYGLNALAITTVTVHQRTGAILDADIEVNSFNLDLSMPNDSPVTNDLLSILTHEAGHFLGLEHQSVEEGVMNPSYDPGDTSSRELFSDDARGVCDIYPPTDESVECDAISAREDTSCLGALPCPPASAADDEEMMPDAGKGGGAGGCAVVRPTSGASPTGQWALWLLLLGWFAKIGRRNLAGKR
jgi:MYXO-CTERM domain-containing protein